MERNNSNYYYGYCDHYLIPVKHIEQGLVHRKYLVNVSPHYYHCTGLLNR